MIFNIFKSKPTLKDLMPDGFIDIHSHVLPGIDDGAKNKKDSLELILEMKKLGFAKIIGTPHTYTGIYDNSNETIINSFKSISNDIPKDLSVSYASEYMLENNIIEKAKNKELLCLKKNYLLTEMSYISAPINLYEIIFELRLNDYEPIIAHPERYRFYHNSFKKLIKLKNMGCKFQINLLSLVGFYGNDVMKMTEKLIENKMADFVGSDVHNINQLHLINSQNSRYKKIRIKNRNIDELEKIFERNFKYFK